MCGDLLYSRGRQKLLLASGGGPLSSERPKRACLEWRLLAG